jgi:6-phosphofructokinase
MDVFRAHDIGYFFYNGGNDSADTCLKVSQIAEKLGYPLRAIHVPKTVDNDLPITDNCPGFGSSRSTWRRRCAKRRSTWHRWRRRRPRPSCSK